MVVMFIACYNWAKLMNDEFHINQDELDSQPQTNRPHEPITYHTQMPMKHPNRHHWKRAFKWLAITILVLGVAAAIFVIINLFKVTSNPFGFGKLKGEAQGRTNIMMLGVGDPGHAGEKLSDTNILLSVDTRNNKVAIIGIPRDTRVFTSGTRYSKINNVHADGGVKASKKAFEDNFGVPIHYYVKANFSGLEEVVDAVGGVDVDNPTALRDVEYPCPNNPNRQCGYRLAAGKHTLNGAQALQYVRCRKGTCGDDFGRAQRQQQVMQSIRDKASSAGTLANPLSLGRLVKAAGNNIDTDLSVNNLMRLHEITKSAGKDSIYNIVFNLEEDGFLAASRDSSDLVPASGDYEDIQEFVRNVFKFGPIWTEHPTVLIQNGTTTPGLGAALETKIELDGQYIKVGGVTNALTRDYPNSQIIDYTNGKRTHTVKYFKDILKVPNTTPPTTVRNAPADIVIILGADYAAAQQQTTGSSGTRSTTPATTR